MTYRAGTYGLEKALGIPDGPPRIICDGGCGATLDVRSTRGFGRPFAWFTKGKAAPGWSGGSNGDGTRTDYCPACKAKPVEKPTSGS